MHTVRNNISVVLICVVCRGSELMGHPDLNIDVSQMKPLLESQQISSLHNESVSNHLFTFSHVLTPAGNTSYLFVYFSSKLQGC